MSHALAAWNLEQRATTARGGIAWNVMGDGPPVVLVHGTPSRSVLWRNVAPLLAERYRVYVFDLLGFGQSERYEQQEVSIRVHGQVLAELVQSWGLKGPALVGHDIGGAAVLRAHLLHGTGARKIVLVDAVVLAPWITATTRHIKAHLDVYRSMPTHIFREVAAAHVRTATQRPMAPDVFAAYFDQWEGERGHQMWLRNVRGFDEQDTADFEPLLDEMQTPTPDISPRKISRSESLKRSRPRPDTVVDGGCGRRHGFSHAVGVDRPLLALWSAGTAGGTRGRLTVAVPMSDNCGVNDKVLEVHGSYRDCSLVRFAELVAAREPAPGGGPVAAITLSLAAALAAMAARFLTQGDFGEQQAQLAERLGSRAADLADADTVAYAAVIKAYAARADVNSAQRAEQIRESMHRAAEVALEVAQLGAETGTLAAQLAAQLAAEGRRSVRGEAVTAVLLAEAATRSAAHLVAVDVDAGGDDELVRLAQGSVDTAHAASSSVSAEAGLSAG